MKKLIRSLLICLFVSASVVVVVGQNLLMTNAMTFAETDETGLAKHTAQDAQTDAIRLENAAATNTAEVIFVLGRLRLDEFVKDTLSTVWDSGHLACVGQCVETHGEHVLVGNLVQI